jgi:hypothetical protein
MTYLEWQNVGQGVKYTKLRNIRICHGKQSTAVFVRNPQHLAVHISGEGKRSY